MALRAYYNEIDPYAAQWIRNLIAADVLTPGEVDQRSIIDVRPDDLVGFDRCHFFAGVGVWDYALNLAGWGESEVWTGSCPCQPFSNAGQRKGVADARHLWPVWYRLIEDRAPRCILGEQVASAKVVGGAKPSFEPAWLDAVFDDLEDASYACGAGDIPAASVGAPHIRQRVFFLADATGQRRHGGQLAGAPGAPAVGGSEAEGRRPAGLQQPAGRGAALGLAHADGGHAGAERQQPGGQHGQQQDHGRPGGRHVAQPAEPGSQGGQQPWQRADAQLASAQRGGPAGGLDLAPGFRRQRGWDEPEYGQPLPADTSRVGLADAGGDRDLQPARYLSGHEGQHEVGAALGHNSSVLGSAARPTAGFWYDADWIPCRDGKARPVEPGTFPLAHGLTNRVGRLRAYGNAINAEAARAFIEAVMMVRP